MNRSLTTPTTHRLGGGLAALALGLSGLAAAASPAAAQTAPVVVLGGICTDGYLDGDTVAAARRADGSAQGFAKFRYSSQCGDRITYFEGAGTAWTRRSTTLVGDVVDVAADETGAYLLYVARDTATPRLVVARRAGDGTLTRLAVLATVTAGAPLDGRGSIVTTGGRWLAVWSQYTGTPGRYELRQAGTLGGRSATAAPLSVSTPTTAASSDTHPALALGPDGQPRLLWQRSVTGGQDLLLSVGAGTSWNPATRVAAGVRISAQHPSLDVAVTDRRTFASWTAVDWTPETSGERAIVASSGGGAWSTSTPLGDSYLGTWDAHLHSVSTAVFTAFGAGDEPPGGALMASRNGSAEWVVSEAPNAVPSSIDTFGVAALVYQRSGRSTALVFSGNRLYAVTG
ncbi:hypothetical protein CLV92_102269 [Kineococcus xinjiangensis]|uniref:BNR repeat neuraminidase n=1 Tax=Kineococcus xinjiangensis TaxID=512762 RepID=A0A2S6IV56_9ACTN|nr:hypothetical protein [Kineococcus xinjiangensis]PPK98116.1 hypothetical protein CLV92_102269 [Kineococcus xinjiangensis]